MDYNQRVQDRSTWNYDLLRDDELVMVGTYTECLNHVLANGADDDTYVDPVGVVQSVYDLRSEQVERERRYTQS